jgi:hypothetical protein
MSTGSPTQAAEDAAPHSRTSNLLLDAVRGDDERVTIGQILDALDARAFGLATLLFAIPSCVPMPPGVPTVVGVALLIVSLQMVTGRKELWLPKFITRNGFSRSALVSGLERFVPFLRGVERVARPRLLFMTGTAGTVFVGILILVMAIILILPLPPGGNFPPALACAILGLGLVERDGLIVLLGALATIAATVVVWLVTAAVIDALPAFAGWLADAWTWLTGLFAG